VRARTSVGEEVFVVGESEVGKYYREGVRVEKLKKIKIPPPPHFIFFRSFLKKVKTGEVENGEVF
jgi:hypothetical protein